MDALHFVNVGSIHGSEYQLTLYPELYIFISQCRFPEFMTNQPLQTPL